MNTHHIEYASFTNLIKEINNNSCSIIITENNIHQIYHHQIFQWIHQPVLNLSIHEKNKSLSSVETIWQFLLNNNVTKKHNIYIIGGGVLHDVALFACSIFKRGLNAISVPTTLLCIIDASIGGKNAINYQNIKNLIGNFYIPSKNIIITDFLNTLSTTELLSGWAEIIKIALVADASFYEQCTQHLTQSIYPDISILQKSIYLKLQIVEQDFYDQNQRQLLNFGHTIAHAIEALYEEQNQYIPHGIAVAQGMMIELQIAAHLNIIPPKTSNQIINGLKNFYAPPVFYKNEISVIINKILQDKKNEPQQIKLTLINNIGSGITGIPVNPHIIEKKLYEFSKD